METDDFSIQQLDKIIDSISKESNNEQDDELKELEDIINKNYRGERIDNIKEEEISKDTSKDDEIIIGIDLGTSNSCVSIWRNNKLEVIPDDKGNLTIPSVIAFANKIRFIGLEARNQSELNPENTYYDIKRLIGRLFSDLGVQRDKQFLSYSISSGNACWLNRQHALTAKESESSPDSFSGNAHQVNDQRALTAKESGLSPESFSGNAQRSNDQRALTAKESEPNSDSFSGNYSDDRIIIEGTRGKKMYTPEELSAMILSKLKSMAEDYLKRPVKKAVVTVPAYFNDSQREATKDAIKIAGLECIRIINEPTAAALAYGFIKREGKQSIILVYDLGGGTLDVSIMKLNLENSVFQVLASAGNTRLGGSDFDVYLMEYCKKEFMKKHKIIDIPNMKASSLQLLKKRCENVKKQLSNKKIGTVAVRDFYDNKDLCVTITRELFEKICASMFIVCMKPIDDALKSCNLDKSKIDDIILVGGSTRIPRIKQNIETYFGKAPNDTVNPDVVVSAGAAIQGYILSHRGDPYSDRVTLLDIVPLSLGVETMRSIMTTIIPRNSIIPIKKTKRFCSDEDNQTSISINVYEGERKLTKDNYFIGSFELNEIDPAPKEIQEILVTFNVDFNGIIDVTAVDKRKEDNKQTIRITSNKGRLTEDEIKLMIKESLDMSLSDKLNDNIRRLRYEINDLCKTILDNINDSALMLQESDKEDVKNDINRVLEWLKNDDIKYDDYYSVSSRIKKNYGTLILKRTKNLDKLKEYTDEKTAGVSVFNSIEEDITADNTIFEKIELEDIITDKMTDDEKKQLLQIREELTGMCYNIYDMITKNNITLKEEEKIEINDVVDDTLLWLHVTEKSTINDYLNKLEKLNDHTNNIISRHNDSIFIIDEKMKSYNAEKTSLINMCYALKCSIDENLLPLQDSNKKILTEAIDETLQWIENESNASIDDYRTKIELLNELSRLITSDIKNLSINTKGVLKRESVLSKDEEIMTLE
jgi:molecular chaperone DnaK (HSP70)